MLDVATMVLSLGRSFRLGGSAGPHGWWSACIVLMEDGQSRILVRGSQRLASLVARLGEPLYGVSRCSGHRAMLNLAPHDSVRRSPQSRPSGAVKALPFGADQLTMFLPNCHNGRCPMRDRSRIPWRTGENWPIIPVTWNLTRQNGRLRLRKTAHGSPTCRGVSDNYTKTYTPTFDAAPGPMWRPGTALRWCAGRRPPPGRSVVSRGKPSGGIPRLFAQPCPGHGFGAGRCPGPFGARRKNRGRCRCPEQPAAGAWAGAGTQADVRPDQAAGPPRGRFATDLRTCRTSGGRWYAAGVAKLSLRWGRRRGRGRAVAGRVPRQFRRANRRRRSHVPGSRAGAARATRGNSPATRRGILSFGTSRTGDVGTATTTWRHASDSRATASVGAGQHTIAASRHRATLAAANRPIGSNACESVGRTSVGAGQDER